MFGYFARTKPLAAVAAGSIVAYPFLHSNTFEKSSLCESLQIEKGIKSVSFAELREKREELKKKWDYQNKSTRLSPIVWPKNFPEEDEIPQVRVNLAQCSKSIRCKSSPEWLQKCADTQFRLATALTVIQSSKEMLKEGAVLMADLAELGHGDGMCGYGMLLSDGKGVESNSEEAVGYWEKAIQMHKHPHATYELGVAYYQGEGVEEDECKAYEYFQEAAKTGHTGAMYMTGDSLLEGIGCERNQDKAVHWLYKAGEAGHRGARSRLLAVLEDGGQIENGLWSDSSRQSFRRRFTGRIKRRQTVQKSRSM
mmetsp:Transcript_6127/g.7423  ORF Transcript_6127/g.7423 Transcript_6127/m.7423 type:complete len:310 (+) Transcript_6127:115-1044(+)